MKRIFCLLLALLLTCMAVGCNREAPGDSESSIPELPSQAEDDVQIFSLQGGLELRIRKAENVNGDTSFRYALYLGHKNPTYDEETLLIKHSSPLQITPIPGGGAAFINTFEKQVGGDLFYLSAETLEDYSLTPIRITELWPGHKPNHVTYFTERYFLFVSQQVKDGDSYGGSVYVYDRNTSTASRLIRVDLDRMQICEIEWIGYTDFFTPKTKGIRLRALFFDAKKQITGERFYTIDAETVEAAIRTQTELDLSQEWKA